VKMLYGRLDYRRGGSKLYVYIISAVRRWAMTPDSALDYMFYVLRSCVAVCCVLYAVCCVLCAVCCVLCAVCCVLCAVVYS